MELPAGEPYPPRIPLVLMSEDCEVNGPGAELPKPHAAVPRAEIPRLGRPDDRERRGAGAPLPGLAASQAARPALARAAGAAGFGQALRWASRAGLALGFLALGAKLLARKPPAAGGLAVGAPAAGGLATTLKVKGSKGSRSLAMAAYTGKRESLYPDAASSATPQPAGGGEVGGAEGVSETGAGGEGGEAPQTTYDEMLPASGPDGAGAGGSGGNGGAGNLSSSVDGSASAARLEPASARGARGGAQGAGGEAGRLAALRKAPGARESRAARSSLKSAGSRDMRVRGASASQAAGQLRGMKHSIGAALSSPQLEASAAAATEMFDGRRPAAGAPIVAEVPDLGRAVGVGMMTGSDSKSIASCGDGQFFDGYGCVDTIRLDERDVSPWAVKSLMAWMIADEAVRDVKKAVVSYATVVGSLWAWAFQRRAWLRAERMKELASEIEAEGGHETAEQVRRAAKDVQWAALASLVPLLGLVLVLRLGSSLKAGREAAATHYGERAEALGRDSDQLTGELERLAEAREALKKERLL